jgi:hypothetical protein
MSCSARHHQKQVHSNTLTADAIGQAVEFVGGSVAARLLGLRVRMLPGTWMSVSCECCTLSGEDLYVRLITRPEESYRLRCV